MMIRCLLVLCLSSMLLACDRPQPLPALSGDAVILAFGDSLTRGTGARRGGGYPEVLAELSGRAVVNAGVPGEESDAALARLPAVLDAVAPDLVILGHGGNDLLRRRDPTRTQANLREMIRLARDGGVAVVLLGVPRPGIFLSVHPLYRELADELDVPLEGGALADILADPALKADQVHPNAAGYRRLAEVLHRLLVDHGAL
ncbi:GDSL-type esterase/lipase family protein [Thiococcus pfennigii]|jgi:lysophospholipase L1-like esterase|uniref:GDSL-type esterase/lipase family protein n=1 Tax=Thiococcus pfennigii TaxID=1057 RepID=UPI0019059FF9|nr:GDSL-type esterase/lipase family protein [Thiococcus pfennigii]MBK1701202.1 arylesterase [Thiococcus pfennigii]MBK1730584.1 arylesterase [Thiococcus pfennigii]